MAVSGASTIGVVHPPESLPLPLVRFLLARPQSLSRDLRFLAVDQGLCPRTIFALARSEGRALILCLVNGEAGENHLHEARRRAAAVARPRVLALASRFAETWQHASGSTQHEKPELWLWSATDPTEPEPMRLSRLTPSTSRAETGGERDVSRPAPARLESPDPWSVTLASGAARLSPEEIASLLDPPGAGTNPLEGAGA